MRLKDVLPPGRYRVHRRIAHPPRGAVYAATDVTTGEERLLVLDPQAAGEKLIVLPKEAELQAARLVGLRELPRQSRLGRAYGWGYLYPKNAAQLLVRIGCTCLLSAMLVWIFFLVRHLIVP